MSHESQIVELLEEILESKRSAEEVCADCPQLLAEVQQRLERMRIVAAQIETLFPEHNSADSAPPRIGVGAELPSIPGYDIQSVLGRGGMGVVYHARHLKLNRPVALKMLLAGDYAHEQERLRFWREAESVAGLRHPNIVQLYDVGEIDGKPYFTMEYVEGGSLSEKIAAQLPVRESAKLLVTLARAVGAAHQRGILHRDLKPANILIAEDGSPKISDFGLARRLDGDSGLTRTGARLGTPSYMAPEQMTGSAAAVAPAVDIYALGAVLYEMLVGKPPFQGDSFAELERQLTQDDPKPPSSVNGKVPRDLETICLKCLEKDPKRRYATAEELADDLERFLQHEPIQARRVSRAERVVRWARRKPSSATLLVACVALFGLLIGEATRAWTLSRAARAEKARLTQRLESAIGLEQQGRYAEAQAILGRLGDGGFDDLRARIDRCLGELKLIDELDAIGIHRLAVIHRRSDRPADQEDKAETDQKYDALFQSIGIRATVDDPATAVQQIAASDIKGALVGAIDDWAVCAVDEQRRNWLLEVARQADPDPSGWRDNARNPAAWSDRDKLTALADTAPLSQSNLKLLRALGDRMEDLGIDAAPFRKRVQQEYPGEFLANYSLAETLRLQDPAESIRYFQAALAISPETAAAYNSLGVALAASGRTDEAIIVFQQAINDDRHDSHTHYPLGMALAVNGKSDEAIEQFQKAIDADPRSADAHGALGKVHMAKSRFKEAQAALRQCLKLLPAKDPDRTAYETQLKQCEQALAAQERPLPADPASGKKVSDAAPDR